MFLLIGIGMVRMLRHKIIASNRSYYVSKLMGTKLKTNRGTDRINFHVKGFTNQFCFAKGPRRVVRENMEVFRIAEFPYKSITGRYSERSSIRPRGYLSSLYLNKASRPWDSIKFLDVRCPTERENYTTIFQDTHVNWMKLLLLKRLEGCWMLPIFTFNIPWTSPSWK